MAATLFDLGGPIAPAPRAPAAPRGGRRKAAGSTPTPSQPPASAIHPAATTEPAPALQLPTAPAPAAAEADDTSFYAFSYRLLRASPTELDALDAKHRAAGYCRPPSPDALAGAISACAPVPCAEPLVRCSCGAEMPARLLDECAARAADPSVWSLHRERMRGGAP